MTRILFVCSQNRLRSPTGEAVFGDTPGIETRSAGLNHDAIKPMSIEDAEWAEIIFVMEQSHKRKLQKRFKKALNDQKLICLGIPDEYEYMDAELIRVLKESVPQFLP